MATQIGRRDMAKAAMGAATAIAFGDSAAAQTLTRTSRLTTADVYALAREAYLYAYPLVTMDTTMRVSTNVPDARTVNMRAPVNQFAHARAYPRAEERDVVRTNFDTLYSYVWLDVAAEPVVVTAPDMAGRYFMLPMLDMWTDVFATIGTRTVGNGGGHYAICSSGWAGPLPDRVERIVAPTPNVWVIGRTQTNGPADYANVHRLQDGYRLTPLSQWGRDVAPPAAQPVDAAVDDRTPPLLQVDSLDGVAMLTRLAVLMRKHPPHPNDYPILLRMRALGIEPGWPFDAARLDATTQETINSAARETLAGLQASFERTAKVVNGWFMQTENIGTYGTSYLRRAMIAKGGLGANLPEDALYPNALADSEGRPLDGAHRYVLRFERGQLPPADAFWSVTMYDMVGFQVPNRLNRFALGDRDRLNVGPDGSVEILVQAEWPGAEREANWLPAPQGRFQPTMRLYSPRAEALDGRWAPPPFRRVG